MGHYVRLGDYKFHAVTWPRDTTDCTSLPEPSQLAVFHNAHDVIGKAVPGTDFWKRVHKNILAAEAVRLLPCVWKRLIRKNNGDLSSVIHISTSQHQQHLSLFRHAYSFALKSRYWSTFGTVCSGRQNKLEHFSTLFLSFGTSWSVPDTCRWLLSTVCVHYMIFFLKTRSPAAPDAFFCSQPLTSVRSDY